MDKSTVYDNLPPEFLLRMKEMLGPEYEPFLESFRHPRRYGLRLNTAKITAEEFKEKRAKTEQDLQDIDNQISDIELKQSTQILPTITIQTLENCKAVATYDPELLSRIIEKVIVHPDKKIEVIFKGKDFIKENEKNKKIFYATIDKCVAAGRRTGNFKLNFVNFNFHTHFGRLTTFFVGENPKPIVSL